MTTPDSGIELLKALGQVETATRAGVSLEAAVQTAANAHGVDAGRLADLFWRKLDGCAEARAALEQIGET